MYHGEDQRVGGMAMEEGMEKRNARAGQELQRNESEKKTEI